MKLSEALIRRADAQTRIAQLRQRLSQSALVQEGERPPEDPKQLLKELDRLLGELTDLIKRINRTNSATEFDKDKTLTDALAERDTLLLERNVLAGLAQAAAHTQGRYSRSEVKYVPTVNVADIQKQMDDLARQHRELDTHIQELNWQVDLVE
jgi:hypothetical protein